MMKKSTIAVAALLSALSTAPMVSIAYADEAPASTTQGTGCQGDKCKGQCAGDKCKGACAGKCKGGCAGKSY